MNKIKQFICILLLLTIHQNGKACDVCGGAIGAGGSDVIPGVFQNYIGIRSNIRDFRSEHLTLFEQESPIRTREWFCTTELHGRYSPIRRFQIFGFLPVNSVTKEEDEVFSTIVGLGDFRVRMNYLSIDQTTDDSHFMNLFAGATLKMPTGRYSFNGNESHHFHPNMLPGTGTWDIGFHTDFLFRSNSLGGILSANYFIRGTNKYNYQFGNISAGMASAFYKKDFLNASLLFELGIIASHLQTDVDLRWNEEQIYSQGWAVLPTAKATFFKGNWACSLSYGKPAFQHLALGQVDQKNMMEMNIIYFLKTTSNENN